MDSIILNKVKKTPTDQNLSIKYWQSVIAFLIVAILLGSLPAVTKQVVYYLTPPVQLAIRYLIAVLFFIPSITKIVFDIGLVPRVKNAIESDIAINTFALSNLSGILPISLTRNNLPANSKLLRDGLILGCLTFGIHLGLSFGVQTISANRTSFLFGLCVIFVALLDLLYRKRFSLKVLLATILAFSGSALMSWEQNSEPLIGTLWILGAVACEATMLIILEDISSNHDPLDLSLVRLGVAAILALGFGLNHFSDQLLIIQSHWVPLFYLGAATAATTWLVIFALQTLPAVEASLIQGLEPIFGTVISFVVLGEVFGFRGVIGSMLILIGTAIAILAPLRKSMGINQLNHEDS